MLQGAQGRDELKQLFNEITTNETSFWRNPPQIEAFQRIVLPEAAALARARGASRLRIWSAACSSGEEPFTLAMICQEARDGLLRGMTVEIVATDISEKVLGLAREGCYGSYTLRNLTPAQVRQHFTQLGPDSFQVKPELKQLINFRNFNLVDYGNYRTLGSFDVIFCRNVLIYFDDAGQGQGHQGVPRRCSFPSRFSLWATRNPSTLSTSDSTSCISARPWAIANVIRYRSVKCP